MVSIPEISDEEQMLRQLQNLQLGIFHGIHSVPFHQKLLHVVTFLHGTDTSSSLGDNDHHETGKILGRIE